MDHVEPSIEDEGAQSAHPTKVPVPTGAERVSRNAGVDDGRRQGVLRIEDIGDLVLEAAAVPGDDGVDKQPLGTTQPEGLDGQQHPELGIRGPSPTLAR